jgi:hypothetical protein
MTMVACEAANQASKPNCRTDASACVSMPAMKSLNMCCWGGQTPNQQLLLQTMCSAGAHTKGTPEMYTRYKKNRPVHLACVGKEKATRVLLLGAATKTFPACCVLGMQVNTLPPWGPAIWGYAEGPWLPPATCWIQSPLAILGLNLLVSTVSGGC